MFSNGYVCVHRINVCSRQQVCRCVKKDFCSLLHIFISNFLWLCSANAWFNLKICFHVHKKLYFLKDISVCTSGFVEIKSFTFIWEGTHLLLRYITWFQSYLQSYKLNIFLLLVSITLLLIEDFHNNQIFISITVQSWRKFPSKTKMRKLSSCHDYLRILVFFVEIEKYKKNWLRNTSGL